MSTNTHDLIRIPARVLDQINEQLDLAAGSHSDPTSRTLKRWDLRNKRVVLTTFNDDGTTAHYITSPRNLSAGGIGLLHGAFVHIGTRCLVSIIDNNNESRSIKGSIVRCTHVTGRIHQVGVAFNEPIRIEEYLPLDDERVLNIENVDPCALQGTVLFIESAQSEQRLFKHQLQSTKIVSLFASDQATCNDLLAESPDLIIVGYETVNNFNEWIHGVREAGYTGPVVVITASKCSTIREEVRAAGAEDAFVKPITDDIAQRICAEHLHPSTRDSLRTLTMGSAVASSSATGIPADLLTSCADEIRTVGSELNKLHESKSIEDIKSVAKRIESIAASHGFEGITEAARELTLQLDSTMSTEEAEPQLVRLATLACKARAVA